ncbi:PREDICTED: protein EARLY FLOWERING 4-like [Nicotiana attenuata]|uniref:Protein early flowering 4 n=1 Tax=Nicotiana attenuata TaxID=49451 RepID=A0A314L0D5_NICAT|nr:PREDICTED: protein EARLY FLOWERING 4-like [Nicotiana attenuata]OIT34915.1 protein early flowering 4 [Nicotiana attenuata]
MDATSQTLTKLSDISKHRLNVDEFNDVKEQEYDTEAWETLSKCFREVQSVLDRNRILIQQVNENHQSMLPYNLVKNVALIRDINHNISKISCLYSDLSVNFCNIVHQRRALDSMESKNYNGKAERR